MKILISTVIFFLTIKLSVTIDCDKEAKNDESRLRKELFCRYDKSVRPVENHNKTTYLRMKYILKNFDFVSITKCVFCIAMINTFRIFLR